MTSIPNGTTPLSPGSCQIRSGYCSVASLGSAPTITLTINPLFAAEKIRFGLNWLPEAEHCGFFQAKAAGLYDKAGLDVELKPGGPDVNTPLLIGVGQLDLAIGTGFTTLNMVEEGIPGVTVAAFFQKDPQTLVAHPDQGIATLADVKGRPVMISSEARQEFWQFLKLKFGFEDSQLRPYTYSAAPFLADPKAIQQGYITGERAPARVADAEVACDPSACRLWL